MSQCLQNLYNDVGKKKRVCFVKIQSSFIGLLLPHEIQREIYIHDGINAEFQSNTAHFRKQGFQKLFQFTNTVQYKL